MVIGLCKMPSKWYICGGTTLAIVAIAIGLLASSFKRLSSDEVGIQYDIHQNQLGSRTYQEGLHTGPPGYTFIKFPKVFKTLSFSALKCLNKDGLTIQLNVQFQYKVDSRHLKALIMEFKNHDTYVSVLKHVAASSVHDSCSEFNVTQFQTERANFKALIVTKLTANFKILYGIVSDVQVNNIQRPSLYEKVIREKESAKQNIQIALSERPRIRTEATTKLREAETQANITIQTAETQARIINAKATAEADAISTAYSTEASTYKDIMAKQGLSVEGLLSYLATRAIQSAKKPVYVGLDAPAKTNYP